MSSDEKKVNPATIVLAPQKRNPAAAASISLRPQRGSGGSSSSSTSSTTGSSFGGTSPVRGSTMPSDSERSNQQGDDFTYPELPTDLAKHIYNKAFFFENKLPMSRLPDLDTANTMKSCNIWTDSVITASALAQSLSGGPYSQSRDQRHKGMQQQQQQKGRGGPQGDSSRGGRGGARTAAGNKPGAGAPGSPSNTAKPTDSKLRPQKKKDEQEVFFGQIQSLLNKLTLEKFEKLSGKLVEQFKLIDTPETLDEAVELVHKKALTEPHFCAMYSDLCEMLSKNSREFPDPAGGKKPITFSKLMLNHCQKVFEERLPVGDVEEEIMNKARKRILGNLVLISELHKRSIVHQTIVQRCVDALFAQVRRGLDQLNVAPGVETLSSSPSTHGSGLAKEMAQQTENSIEKLCQMLSSVGKFWESRNQQNKSWMDQHIDSLKDFASNKMLNNRTRFLLRNVIDMRLNDWVPRRKVEGPQKLDDIKLQAELEYDGILPIGGVGGQKMVPAAEFEKRAREQDAASQRARTASGGSSGLPATPARAAPMKAVATDDDDVSVEALQEYLKTDDADELSLSVRELQSLDKFVTATLNWALEKNPSDSSSMLFTQLADVFVLLKDRHTLNANHFIHGFQELSSSLDDLVVDVPYAPTMLGYFLGHSVGKGVLTAEQAALIVQSCLSDELRAKLVTAMSHVKL